MADITLFPAHAGVIPTSTRQPWLRPAFPRTCGGDPRLDVYNYICADFSPHTRG